MTDDHLSQLSHLSPVSPLVETDDLHARLGRGGFAIVDCTVHLEPLPTGGVAMTSGRASYDGGHLPGAVFADLLTAFRDPDHPKPFALPSPERFAADVAALGISNGDLVVAYDQGNGVWATRFWWLLRAFGHDEVAVLNGGLRKWTLEGRPVTTDVPSVGTGAFAATFRPEMVATRDDVVAATEDPGTCLVNALSPAQHSGRVPVASGRRGHIPSSVNVPVADLVDPSTGAFLPLPALKERLDQAGATSARQVIAYCAAGPNATLDAFALHVLGMRDVAIYDGGLVEWSSDPDLPLVAEAS